MSLNCEDVANLLCSDCNEDEPNRIIHIGFVKKSVTIDVTQNIIDQLLQAERACNAKIFRNTNATNDGGASSTGKGQGKQTARLLAKTHTIVATDFNITNNVTFWNSFQKTPRGYYPIYFTSNKAWIVKKTVSLMVDAKAPITDDINTFIEGNITITWSDLDTAITYTVDSDLLEACQILFESDVADWTNESGSMASVIGSEIDVLSGDDFEVSFDTDEELLTAVSDVALPTGVTIGVSGTKIVISGNSTVLGTTEIVVTASNACGLSGTTNVTLIISA